MLAPAAHLLRPHSLLRGALRNVSVMSDPLCMNRPSPSVIVQQSQRFASTASATNLRHGVSGSSLVQSMTIRGAFKNASAAPSPTIRSQSWIIAGTVTGCAFGPLIFSRTASAGSLGVFPSSHRVVHCAAATTLPGANNIQLNASLEKEPLINTKELTFGMVMGLCSGYLFKKLGRMMMIVVGLGFVWMQLLSSSGYIQVNWPLIERRFKETFDLDKDGKVTMNDARHGFRLLLELLTKNFQFKATYVGGYIMGFRYG